MKTILLTKGFFQALMSLAKKSMSLMVIMMVGLSLAMTGCDNNDKKMIKPPRNQVAITQVVVIQVVVIQVMKTLLAALR